MSLRPAIGMINSVLLSAPIWAVLGCAAFGQNLQADQRAQAIAIVGDGGGGGTVGRTQRIVTVPGVVPPSFYGANPCSNSASGGGAGMGFGISIGGQWSEQECRDQEWFRFLHMAGQGNVATAYICGRNTAIRQAYRDAGQPCPQDVPAVAPLPVAGTTPAPVGVQAAPPPASARPDWCGTASPAERRRYPACG